MLISFVRTVIIYIVLVLCIRLMGKRQLGELSLTELVVAFLLSDLASLPLQDASVPLTTGLIPILTLVCLEIFASWLNASSMRLRHILTGKPSVIISNGIINQHEMSRLRLNMDDLMEELRLKQVSRLSDVLYAVVEPTGKVSVILRAEATPVTCAQLGIKPIETGYEILVVSDGELSHAALHQAGKSEEWFEAKLTENGFSSVKDVFLLTVDALGNVYAVRKEEKSS